MKAATALGHQVLDLVINLIASPTLSNRADECHVFSLLLLDSPG